MLGITRNGIGTNWRSAVCVCVCVCVCMCKFQARLLISASEWTELEGGGVGGGGLTSRRAPQCGCYAGLANRNVWAASNCISLLHQLRPFLAKGHI